MKFRFLKKPTWPPKGNPNDILLVVDSWDDFGFKTLYSVYYIKSNGQRQEIGSVKIARFEQESERADLPEEFEKLDKDFFSLGQDVEYYAAIMNAPNLGRQFLRALRDIAEDEALYKRAIKEPVTRTSLFRFQNEKTVEGQFRRIIGGGAVLTPFNFTYTGAPASEASETDAASPMKLDFEVKVKSKPPTNIHVLIGRNGVGKTHLQKKMVKALCLRKKDRRRNGHFAFNEPENSFDTGMPFVNVLFVSFSVFDDPEPLISDNEASEKVKFAHIGIHKLKNPEAENTESIPLAIGELKNHFVDGLENCLAGGRRDRLSDAIKTLEADILFAQADLLSLLDLRKRKVRRNEAGEIFKRLSSGHKIVLLTMVKLVENVDERTLVLLDEPEGHLHPPLLSAFIRALSDLLVHRNGVAIIATHSPVVLQEVPKSCVWRLSRFGVATKAERLEIETFGENIGVLTRQVFGLEVMKSGFHKMLSDVAEDETELDSVLASFNGEVGGEGKALIAAMIAEKGKE